jgi:hypothetical protein
VQKGKKSVHRIMENELIRIPKLKGIENWAVWKFQTRVILQSSDAWSIVDGSSAIPVQGQTIDETTFNRTLAAWKKNDSIAQRIIATTVEEKPLLHILNCKSAKDMWDKLIQVYEQKSETSIHMLMQQWYNLQMKSDDDIAIYVARLEDLAHRLEIMGEKIPDQMLITKLLMTLPPTYKYFISAWESTSSDQRTLANLISRLTAEESRMSSENPENVAFASTKVNWNKPVLKGTCNYCKKPGHWIRDCKKRKAANERKAAAHHDGRNEALIGEALSTVQDSEKSSEIWYLDSGATDHMSNQRRWFQNFKHYQEPKFVRIGNGKLIPAIGSGNVDILAYNGESWIPKFLSDVLYVPDLTYNLFSLGATLDKGIQYQSDDRTCRLFKGGNVVAVGERRNKLFEMKFRSRISNPESQANAAASVDSLQTWHNRLAHQHAGQVKKILRKSQTPFDDQDFLCKSCIFGKMHRLPFPKSISRSSRVGELIHMDLCGPMQEKSLGGARYFLLLKDDFSHWRTLYFIKQKSDTCKNLEDFIKKTEKHLPKGLKILRSDNGLEFVNAEIRNITQRYGIIHQKTVSYTPEQNGAAERENRTIVELARTLLQDSGLPMNLWAEAVNFATYNLNWTGTSSQSNVFPSELWLNKKPDVKTFHFFGEKCYTHIPKEKRRKWDPKAEEGYFVGYDLDTKGYRVWFPCKNQVKTHRDIVFMNQKYQDHQRDNDKDVVEVIVNHPHQEPEHEEQEAPENQKLAESESEMSDEEEDESIHDSLPKTREESEQEQDPVQQDTYSLRDRSKIRNPERFANISILNAEPESFEEATSSGNAEQWKQAMDEEIQSLKQNQTWTLVEPPKNQQVIDNRWVYKIKRNEDGSVQKYKARLVARGFRQVAGVDYNETFSPVTKFDSIRMILCVAASEKLILRQFDVKTAFLYGNIDEILYMQQPDGYQDGTKRVCKLNRSLYGLKQASRCWNQRFTSVLSRLGLHPTNADACVFTNGDPKNQLILAIHIDDGLIAASRQSEIDKLLQELHQEFEITSNPVGTYLGLQIKRMDDGSIFLHQKVYAENVVQRFRMEHANSVKIPADQHHQMDPEMHTNGDKETDNKLYRQIIGSLMYLSLGTRPDITYAVNKASQFLENPRKIHWKAAKRIVKYLKGTINHGLYFPVKQEGHVYAFSDADYAGDVTSRKSTTGIVVKLGTAIIAWKSTRQKIVALSTTEAEYVAACQTVKELIWLKLLLSELAIFENFKATLHVDNESAIKLIKNPEFHQRSKHIDVRYHFIRDKYTMGEFNLVHVSSKQQQADILTKPLPRVGFEEQRRMLNVRDIKDIDEHHLQTAGPS